MATSDDNFISKIFLNGYFSKTAAMIYLSKKFYITHIFYVLLWGHIKEERIFMDFC